MSAKALRTVALALVAAVTLAGCGSGTGSTVVPGGEAKRGRALIASFGCGACHVISGIAGARGHVGPSLQHFESKGSIAGKLPNTPRSVERWIVDPQAIRPGTVMPVLGVSPQEARDITAYLYTQ